MGSRTLADTVPSHSSLLIFVFLRVLGQGLHSSSRSHYKTTSSSRTFLVPTGVDSGCLLCSLLASTGPGSSPLGPLLCGSPLGGVLSQNLQGMLPLLGPPVFGAGGLPGVILVLRSCPWDQFVALCPLPDPSSYPQPFSCAVWCFGERARGGQGHLQGWPSLALPRGLPLLATAPFSISDGRRRLASPSPPTRRLLGVCCVQGTVTVLRVCPRTEHSLALSELSPLHAERVVGLHRELGC